MNYRDQEKKDANRAIAYLVESGGMEWVSVRSAIPFACEVTGVDGTKKRRSQIAVECHNILNQMGIIPPTEYIAPWHRHGFERIFARRSKKGKYEDFYDSWEWKKARYNAIQRFGRKCMCCGATDEIVVDHIIPIKRRWELRLEPSNLQILCRDCNMGKSNIDTTDFRKAQGSYKLT